MSPFPHPGPHALVPGRLFNVVNEPYLDRRFASCAHIENGPPAEGPARRYSLLSDTVFLQRCASDPRGAARAPTARLSAAAGRIGG